ncbi:transmembrane protein, putative (macronuclear) [Tetrahymena thermophila SB210]|uniref:Transmembrane protein, putative n=1 Tax=Tetrahymena thermophila (strain SB210) TaxID=312017 RepID=W7XHB2_TETTS|nr:transmembrane protein, putative [Tetrahymena thermophila SB210]EWS76593.1 transmembrane protein, putative [Tetrahymena thermophila SB210]|eukprot:XP_012650879.1 transmembrane protein, putative [Tetrahymena thermophila SB210]
MNTISLIIFLGIMQVTFKFYFLYQKKINLFDLRMLKFILLLGLISNKIGSKFDLVVQDHLSRKNGILQTVQILLVYFSIILKYNGFQSVSLFFMFFCAVINGVEEYLFLPFLDRTVNKLSLQLNSVVCLGQLIICLAINVNGKRTFFVLITLFVLAIKLASNLQIQRENNINSIFFLKSANQSNFFSSLKPYEIDIHIRFLISKQLKPPLSDNSKIILESVIFEHYQSCLRRPYCFCEQITNVKF